MKRILLLSLLLFSPFIFDVSLFAQNNQSTLIQHIQVQQDFVEYGVKGIKLTTKIDLKSFQKKYSTDSLLNTALKTAKFSISLTIWKDSNLVTPAFGYAFLQGKNDFIVIKQPISLKNVEIDNSDCITFIPYAALKLPEGNQTLHFQADLTGKDGFNTTYKQQFISAPISFIKPLTKLFELSLDSIQVKPFDNKGQAWDHELFGADSPDLDFSIKMGSLEVGNIHKGNSYFISFTSKPRIFRFLVSENDEVMIFLIDTDEVFHDAIASWKFDTSNMKEAVSYQQKEAKANLEGFSFKCKVEKVKQ
jgi:hypothetical protein